DTARSRDDGSHRWYARLALNSNTKPFGLSASKRIPLIGTRIDAEVMRECNDEWLRMRFSRYSGIETALTNDITPVEWQSLEGDYPIATKFQKSNVKSKIGFLKSIIACTSVPG